MRKWEYGALGFLGLAILLFFLLSRAVASQDLLDAPADSLARVHFSDGRIQTLPAATINEFKWATFKGRTTDRPVSDRLIDLVERLMLIEKFPIPNPPELVNLEAHLQACASRSKLSFSLHDDFSAHRGSLNFIFGAEKDARNENRWIEANLNSIRTNGIAIGPKNAATTNILCALIISSDGVRIIPESRLLDHYAQSSPD